MDWSSEIALDRASEKPLSGQLANAIEQKISAGVLPSGSRLPTTRELATALGVNRGTVQAAYRILQEAGLARGRVGSGTEVSASTTPPPEFDPRDLLSDRVAGLSPEDSPASGVPLVADFSRLTPDERFFPLEEFTRVLAEAWSRRADLWQYAPPLGLEDLRTEIARRLAEHGVQRGPDEILVTSGAQQGLDLIFRTFTDPGDSVAMESPTYSGALALARFAGVRIVELPVGPEGADPAALQGSRPKLVYLMPERQNPTGVTAADGRRDEIVRAVSASGALLVEDGYEEPESGISPLAARLPDQTVWLGTLSKDLVPGFRIGWIAGPRQIVETLARVKKTADFQTPLPLQAAVAAFLREGADRKARRARAFDVEAKRISAVRLLKHLLPEIIWMGGEIGNPLFWINLPRGVSGRRVAEAAAARGVGVAAGSDFDPRGEDRANVRLSVSRVDKRDVEKGIRLFAEAVHAVIGSSGIHAMPVV
ncbi:MAG TPA: PLP-dependent aminotransferase family protein [Thermoanaerobaculia bacterium]|nr:PLP-dependent aminotransferase family protein [Thermoanaerobaculia bacterium]